MLSKHSKFQSECLDQAASPFFTRLPREIRDLVYQQYIAIDAIVDGVSTNQPEHLFLDEDKPYEGDGIPFEASCQKIMSEMRCVRRLREVAITFYSPWNFRLQLAVKGRLDWACVQKIRLQLRNEDRFNTSGAEFTKKAMLRTRELKILHIDCSSFNEASNRAIEPNIIISSADSSSQDDEDEADWELFAKLHWIENLLADCGTQLERLEMVVLEGKGRYPTFWPEQVKQFVNDNVEVIELG
ncbi:hypothetical protein VFPPC_11088 [Pochonia chlamydosporia 170]|uniref:Uncharacterized protein n=1 Tax=Pochonia chlamydosporia 170 TaxID=1380566 RepID=A0A179FBH4_METCM|nr:hypothetical protein VFPPC_11088 [Pochonia chlamydosporia 170]OAQ62631.1 hypothetical protein VFPPC_11088 [Pochonia chlamydosporia 170]